MKFDTGQKCKPTVVFECAGWSRSAGSDRRFELSGEHKAGAECSNCPLEFDARIPCATDVLITLLDAIQVESVAVMKPDSGPEPEIFEGFRQLLPKKVEFKKLGRMEFYNAVNSPDTCLVIQTGEQRLYANLILQLDAIAPG